MSLSDRRQLDVDMVEEVELGGGKWFERYLVALRVRKWTVLTFWSVLFILSCMYGPGFATMGNDRLPPPKGSRAAEAAHSYEERFNEKSKELPVLVLIECTEKCHDLRTNEMEKFYKKLENFVLEFNRTNNNVINIMSWYKFHGTLLDDMKGEFMNKKHEDTFINIVVRANNSTEVRHRFIRKLGKTIDDYNPNPGKYEIGVTGFDAMYSANEESAKKQIMRVDAFTIPIAVVILTYMIGSWRLLLLAGLCMASSVLVSFSFMRFTIEILGAPRPEATTPQLMEIICVALTIDYSLFLLRRFQDEIEKGGSTSYAVYVMMFRAGHVVMSSGLTLLLVMMAYLLIPSESIRMDGISCAVGITMCMLVNLSITPTLIYSFPDFFSADGKITTQCTAKACGLDRDGPASNQRDMESTLLQHSYDSDNDVMDGINPLYNTFRVRITKMVTKFPNNLICVVSLYVLAIPLAWKVSTIELDHNILQLMPRHTAETERLHRMYQEFPGGTFAPFDVLMNLPAEGGHTVLRGDFFHLANDISKDIEQLAECDGKCKVSSPARIDGKRVPTYAAETLLSVSKLKICSIPLVEQSVRVFCSAAAEYHWLWESSVNKKWNSMLINIIVPYFPFDKKAKTFQKKVTEILDKYAAQYSNNQNRAEDVEMVDANSLEERPSVSLYLTGFEVGPEAIQEAVFKVFPFMVMLTMFAVFLTLGFMLRSYFVTVRLALTLFLPLSSVFGLAILVYQDGIFNWTGIHAISSSGGFFWSLPIMIITMIAGLVLDMDIFLITRIMEHRSKGYDIRSATVKAVAEVGSTITAAGCIMISCFCGLLLSEQTFLDQCGWLLSTSVLVDIFILNTLLVPALVSLGDRVAWQPTKMPMHNLITLDSPEFTDSVQFL